MTLPNCVPHGPMTCDRCWKDVTATYQETGPFRLVRDPGHWGSASPSVLVLGVSKGNTQSNAFSRGLFDDVAFKKIRHRLLEVLQTIGLLSGETPARFECRFLASEREYAFASVVRCSLTGMDRKRQTHTADSPNVVPAFKPGSEGYAFASACVDQHIGRLPSETRTIILLGNTDSYIKNLQNLIGCTLGFVTRINDVAYRAGGALFVHASHPSKGNGHFGAFNRGEGTPGVKMRLAREALLQAARLRIE
jgi:hypothetical protein